MKSIVLFLLLLLFFLVACEGGGNVYNHLQKEEVGKIHVVNYVNETNDVGQANNQSVYEHLQENLQSNHCKGIFTQEEQGYQAIELQAYATFNDSLCDELPLEPLIFTCNGLKETYYSKERCQNFFSEETS